MYHCNDMHQGIWAGFRFSGPVTNLDTGVLLITLSSIQAHTPDHLHPVLHQHFDEGKLVKVQQVHKVGLHLGVWNSSLHAHKQVGCGYFAGRM